MESEVFLLGHWKNYSELEENLSIEELEATLSAFRETKREDRKFAAALKGIDIEKDSSGSVEERFEKVQLRAASRITGKSEDELTLGKIGIQIEIEGE